MTNLYEYLRVGFTLVRVQTLVARDADYEADQHNARRFCRATFHVEHELKSGHPGLKSHSPPYLCP